MKWLTSKFIGGKRRPDDLGVMFTKERINIFISENK